MSNYDIAYKLATDLETAAVGLALGITGEQEGFSIEQAPLLVAFLDASERMFAIAERNRAQGK